jgi:transcriptional regulator with XRE-family HTH domain
LGLPTIDLDFLATSLHERMQSEDFTIRGAASEIGCSAATLSRMLQGSSAPNIPDTANLFRAVSWLGKTLADFEKPSQPRATSLADVELHLRALPTLSEKDKEALVAIVKAAHDAFRHGSKKKS